MPSAARLIALHGLNVANIIGTGPKRNNILKGDVLNHLSSSSKSKVSNSKANNSESKANTTTTTASGRKELEKLAFNLNNGADNNSDKTFFACIKAFSPLLKKAFNSEHHLFTINKASSTAHHRLEIEGFRNFSRLLYSDIIKDSAGKAKELPSASPVVAASFSLTSGELKQAYLEESPFFNVTVVPNSVVCICYDPSLFSVPVLAETMQRVLLSQ